MYLVAVNTDNIQLLSSNYSQIHPLHPHLPIHPTLRFPLSFILNKQTNNIKSTSCCPTTLENVACPGLRWACQFKEI